MISLILVVICAQVVVSSPVPQFHTILSNSQDDDHNRNPPYYYYDYDDPLLMTTSKPNTTESISIAAESRTQATNMVERMPKEYHQENVDKMPKEDQEMSLDRGKVLNDKST